MCIKMKQELLTKSNIRIIMNIPYKQKIYNKDYKLMKKFIYDACIEMFGECNNWNDIEAFLNILKKYDIDLFKEFNIYKERLERYNKEILFVMIGQNKKYFYNDIVNNVIVSKEFLHYIK